MFSYAGERVEENAQELPDEKVIFDAINPVFLIETCRGENCENGPGCGEGGQDGLMVEENER